MPGLFVTGTGTDVGKTYVTTGLIRAGRRAGRVMDALKPVLTGFSQEQALDSDAGRLLAALGRPIEPTTIAAIAPWCFAAPLSPDMAAAREGRHLDFDALVAACRERVRADALCLIEGAGGVMVPLDDRHTILDLMVALGLPVVLVAATGLGSISHALTARETLRAKGLRIAMIVLNETAGSTVPLDATLATMTRFCPGTPLLTLLRDAPDRAFEGMLADLSFALA